MKTKPVQTKRGVYIHLTKRKRRSVLMTSDKFTFGGYPAAEAQHWTDETYQALGKVVFLLMSGSGEKALRGYTEYYRLKRQFIVEEWEMVIESLERFRAKKGFATIGSMLNTVQEKLVASGRVEEIDGASSELPLSLDRINQPVTTACGESVEQMSLF